MNRPDRGTSSHRSRVLWQESPQRPGQLQSPPVHRAKAPEPAAKEHLQPSAPFQNAPPKQPERLRAQSSDASGAPIPAILFSTSAAFPHHSHKVQKDHPPQMRSIREGVNRESCKSAVPPPQLSPPDRVHPTPSVDTSSIFLRELSPALHRKHEWYDREKEPQSTHLYQRKQEDEGPKTCSKRRSYPAPL